MNRDLVGDAITGLRRSRNGCLLVEVKGGADNLEKVRKEIVN